MAGPSPDDLAFFVAAEEEGGDTSFTTTSLQELFVKIKRELSKERAERYALEERVRTCEKQFEYERVFREDHSQQFATKLGTAVNDLVGYIDTASQVATDALAIAKSTGERMDEFLASQKENSGTDAADADGGSGPDRFTSGSTVATAPPDSAATDQPQSKAGKVLDEHEDALPQMLPRDEILHKILTAVENLEACQKDVPRYTPRCSRSPSPVGREARGDGNGVLCEANADPSAVTIPHREPMALATSPKIRTRVSLTGSIKTVAPAPVETRVGAVLRGDIAGTAIGSPAITPCMTRVSSPVSGHRCILPERVPQRGRKDLAGSVEMPIGSPSKSPYNMSPAEMPNGSPSKRPYNMSPAEMPTGSPSKSPYNVSLVSPAVGLVPQLSPMNVYPPATPRSVPVAGGPTTSYNGAAPPQPSPVVTCRSGVRFTPVPTSAGIMREPTGIPSVVPPPREPTATSSVVPSPRQWQWRHTPPHSADQPDKSDIAL